MSTIDNPRFLIRRIEEEEDHGRDEPWDLDDGDNSNYQDEEE